MRKLALLTLLLLTACNRSQEPMRPICVAKRFDPAKHNITITLDAGHGGHDPGARSPWGDYEEKNLALATALMTRTHLQNLGYRVIMTRSNDTFLKLPDRAKVANDAKTTLFVSIHYNAATNKDAHGVEVFSYRNPKPQERETDSQKLAADVLRKVLANTHAAERGTKKANFAVLRRTEMPAILVEGGFVTNLQEMERLKDPNYLNSIAKGIAEGVNAYCEAQYCSG